MKNLSALLAKKQNDVEQITELVIALGNLKIAQSEINMELAGMTDARQKAFEEGDDAALAALRSRRPVLEDERDRLKWAAARVGTKLAEARAASKRALLAELRTAHDEAVAVYLNAAYRALKAFDAIVEVRSDAISKGFAGAMAAIEMPPNLNGNAVLARDLLDAFAQKPSAPERRPKGTARNIVPLIPRMTDSQGPVRLGVLPVQRRTRRAPIREAADEGAVSLVVLKPGIDLPGRATLAIGDEITLPKDEANNLLRSGAVDVVTRAPEPITAAPLKESVQ